jgi:polysaccharide biosynthesis/export protein
MKHKGLMATLWLVAGWLSLAGAALAAAAPASSGVAPDYIIGPGDTIQVFVWRNPELSVTVPVRPDGKISTPLNEDMVAVGKTPSTLARDIEARLAEYVRSPTVNIIVSNPQSAFSQVKVIGQVKSPQNIGYREGMTVLDAILAVGGVTDFAAPGRTKVVRKTGDKTEEIRIYLDKVLEKGELKYNLPLRAGDVIVVPESRF